MALADAVSLWRVPAQPRLHCPVPVESRRDRIAELLQPRVEVLVVVFCPRCQVEIRCAAADVVDETLQLALAHLGHGVENIRQRVAVCIERL